MISVHLSDRGWGEYSPVEWIGDETTPIGEIIRQCQQLLRNGHDVDKRSQTDAQIHQKVCAEIEKHRQIEKNRQQAPAVTVVPPHVLYAYKQCGGDADRLEEMDGDNVRADLVRQFTTAIELLEEVTADIRWQELEIELER